MARNKAKSQLRERRSFSEEFKQEAVQMLLDGHSAASVITANRSAGFDCISTDFRFATACRK